MVGRNKRSTLRRNIRDQITAARPPLVEPYLIIPIGNPTKNLIRRNALRLLRPTITDTLLAHRDKQLKKYERKLERLDTHQLHALRILVKKQRYAVEFFSGLYPQKKTRRYIQSLSRLQEVLGVINDAAVVERLLGELPLKGNQDEENQGNEREAVGIIGGWSASRASIEMRELSRAWGSFSKSPIFW